MKISWRDPRVWLVKLLFLAAILPTIMLYGQYAKNLDTVAEKPTLSELKVREVMATVSKLVKLPKGELPYYVRAKYTEQLQRSIFFTELLPGDEILYFDGNQKVLVYRRSTNQIVGQYPEGAFPPANPR